MLLAQLESIDKIQGRRLAIWKRYREGLTELFDKEILRPPFIPDYATNNAHMFYFTCEDGKTRDELLDFLKKSEINAVFHYLSLHKSKYFKDKHDGRELPMADFYSDTLVRLPLYYDLKSEEVDYIIEKVLEFFSNR